MAAAAKHNDAQFQFCSDCMQISLVLRWGNAAVRCPPSTKHRTCNVCVCVRVAFPSETKAAHLFTIHIQSFYSKFIVQMKPSIFIMTRGAAFDKSITLRRSVFFSPTYFLLRFAYVVYANAQCAWSGVVPMTGRKFYLSDHGFFSTDSFWCLSQVDGPTDDWWRLLPRSQK